MLICGDLFDSNGQSKRSVERAVGELHRLTERAIRVVIIPGTHDCYDSRSIYRAFDLAALARVPEGSDLLTVLTPDRPDIVIADLDIVVYGRVFPTKRAPSSPLAGFTTRGEARATWKVGIDPRCPPHRRARSNRTTSSSTTRRSPRPTSTTSRSVIGTRSPRAPRAARRGRTAERPSRSRSTRTAPAASASCVWSSGVGGRTVRVDRITVGRTVFRTETVDVSTIASQEDLVRQLAQRADPDVVMHVQITGVARDGFELFTDEVERELASSFLHVRVVDRSASEVAPPPDLPRDTVAGRFVADMEERIRSAEASGDVAAAEHAREVSRLGRRLLLDDASRVTLA